MKSPVLELQKLASDNKTSASALLKKSLIVAKKLDMKEFEDWIKNEMNGYDKGKEIPKYRDVFGDIRVINPVSGTYEKPIFEDPDHEELFATKPMTESINEIEHYIETDKEGNTTAFRFPPKLRETFMQGHSHNLEPILFVSTDKLIRITEKVKQIVLEWSLDLESQNILGDQDLTFDSEEKSKASKIEYNIENFSGVIGNINDSNVQIGDYSQIHSILKKKGVPQEDRNEFENIVDEVEKAEPEKKKSLVKKAFTWISAHSTELGTFSETLRGWVETIAGT